MKRLLALALVIVMCFALLTACSNSQNSNNPSNSNSGTNTPSNSNPSDSQGSDTDSQPVQVELSFASYLPEGTPMTSLYKYLMDETNAILGGNYLTITPYASGTLAGSVDMVDSLESGLCDIGLVQVSTAMDRFPVIAVAQQPGILYESGMAVTAAQYDFIRNYAPAAEELGSNTLLLTLGTGYGAIYANKPIHGLDDLKNMMVRATATTVDVVTSWGAVPVTLEWSDCYEALRNNVVEALYADGAAAALFHMADVINYYTYYPMYNDVHMVLISEQGMAKLPQVMQDALLEASDKVMQEHCIPVVPTLAIMSPVYTEFFAGINEVTFLPDETLAEMRELSAPVLNNYVEALNSKGYNGQEALDTFLAYVKQYNAEWPGEDVIAEFANYSDNIWTGK